MKIVAFLQNQWFKDPVRAAKIMARYEANGDGREAFIRDMLFMSCLTGKRIRTAFGKDLCSQIVWEEVSCEIGGKSDSVFKPDREHILGVLAKHSPDIVLTFGKVALNGLMGLGWESVKGSVSFYMIAGPHPAARGPDVLAALSSMAASLRTEIERVTATLVRLEEMP